jgi:hypothetical protein
MALLVQAKDIHLYGTVGIVSHHFDKDEHGNAYNKNHQAYGAEISYDNRYTATYLHFKNSRYRQTDVTALGYRYDLYGPFGIYGVVGYQKGYCFENFKSVECSEGKDDSGITVLPMIYYRHDYFIVDLIAQQNMIAIKLNVKLY